MGTIATFRPLLALAAVLLVACEGDPEPGPEVAEEPVVAFEEAPICIVTATDTLPLTVELAETEAQRAYGLMERTQLDPDAGMLFTYAEPQPPEGSFWMYRTRIPLDIAFVGPEGEIRAIRTMQPCLSPDPRWCESYAAGVEFQAALEVGQGFFASRGVEVGDRLIRDPRVCPGG